MKAFLSHSSTDKEFVETVAILLGRQFCVFDKFSFGSADEFKLSIERGLDQSRLFVLFASTASLTSSWVDFEAEEALFRKIQREMERVLVLILDESIRPSSLPIWLQRMKAVHVTSPREAVREIRIHLDVIMRARFQTLFIGRTHELETVEKVLLPPETSDPPRFLIVIGLPQIGRRSLARKAAANLLSLQKTVEFELENGDDTADVCFKVAAEIEPYSSQEGLPRIQRAINALSFEDVVKRTVENLQALVHSGTLPLFIDRGGLLDENGEFSVTLREILRAMQDRREMYAFFLTSQRPTSVAPLFAEAVRVPPLSTDDSKKLLLAIALREQLTLSTQELGELTEYVGGYPPACYYAVELAKHYGLPAVLADKSTLVAFRVTAFVKYLAEHGLSETQNAVIRLLSQYSPLPLPVVGGYIGEDPAEVAKQVMRLTDLSIMYPDKDGYYSLAEPLRDAAFKQFAFFRTMEHKRVADLLLTWLDENEDATLSLGLSRVIYRASELARHPSLGSRVVHLLADTIRLAELAYIRQEYDLAIQYGEKALLMRPRNDKALILLIRALAQVEEWERAEANLKSLESLGISIRTTAFLRGFVARRNHRFEEAIRQYELAVKARRHDVAVFRELAWCHHILKDFEQAENYLKMALDEQPDNPYVLDMAAQIAIAKGDEVAASVALTRLHVVDNKDFYWHRRSTFDARFGKLTDARASALRGVAERERPRFEALVHLIYCDIRLGNLREAEERLAEMEGNFGRFLRRLQFALRCDLELAQGKAAQVLERIDRSTLSGLKYVEVLKAKAITQLLATSVVQEKRRRALEDELSRLEVSPNAELSFLDLPRFES